jgi:hypothetical protein
MECLTLHSDQPPERASLHVSRSAIVALNLIPTLAMAGAVWLHVRAGVFDEGRAVWRPGGHLSIFVVFAWLGVGALGVSSAIVLGRRAPLAYFACAAALVGLALVLTA